MCLKRIQVRRRCNFDVTNRIWARIVGGANLRVTCRRCTESLTVRAPGGQRCGRGTNCDARALALSDGPHALAAGKTCTWRSLSRHTPEQGALMGSRETVERVTIQVGMQRRVLIYICKGTASVQPWHRQCTHGAVVVAEQRSRANQKATQTGDGSSTGSNGGHQHPETRVEPDHSGMAKL